MMGQEGSFGSLRIFETDPYPRHSDGTDSVGLGVVMRILLVDDEPSIQRGLAPLLITMLTETFAGRSRGPVVAGLSVVGRRHARDSRGRGRAQIRHRPPRGRA